MSAPEIESISNTLRLTQALNLARRGRLREAQSVISPGGGVPPDPVALQALAALATAEGDFRRAVQLWRAVLQREPANPDARRLIPAIELWLLRPAWMSYVPLAAGALGFVVLTIVLALMV